MKSKTVTLRDAASTLPRQARAPSRAPAKVPQAEVIDSTPPPSSRRDNVAGDIELTDIVAFVRVVDAGSFTRAAAKSPWPKSALSRRVARLEQSLGVRLLQRTTRSLSLTDAGAAYHARASVALAQLNEARDLAAETTLDPSGIVRISSPVDLGTGPFSEVLADFAQRYPKIHVDVDASARFVDLVAEGFDLAVRAGQLRDSSLVARKLGEAPQLLVATPGYLDKHGRPSKLFDLEQHACVLFRANKGESVWKLVDQQGAEHSVRVRGPLSGSDFSFVRAAALRGVGIGLVPLSGIIEDIQAGRLEWVLPELMGPSAPIHLVYPSSRFVPQRVALLRDFLVERLRFDCPSKTDHKQCLEHLTKSSKRPTKGE
ncbi:MAG: LysR family transcriptional regulator [Polyangiaceae bacterium]|nr:LysR family transcriptional regulator [Polyangiaceae bacterium]